MERACLSLSFSLPSLSFSSLSLATPHSLINVLSFKAYRSLMSLWTRDIHRFGNGFSSKLKWRERELESPYAQYNNVRQRFYDSVAKKVDDFDEFDDPRTWFTYFDSSYIDLCVFCIRQRWALSLFLSLSSSPSLSFSLFLSFSVERFNFGREMKNWNEYFR